LGAAVALAQSLCRRAQRVDAQQQPGGLQLGGEIHHALVDRLAGDAAAFSALGQGFYDKRKRALNPVLDRSAAV
jgi:hypothetical protein